MEEFTRDPAAAHTRNLLFRLDCLLPDDSAARRRARLDVRTGRGYIGIAPKPLQKPTRRKS
jgi:hypothetical protein